MRAQKHVIIHPKDGRLSRKNLLIMCPTIYYWKYKSYSLVLLNVFIESYGIAKCIREVGKLHRRSIVLLFNDY